MNPETQIVSQEHPAANYRLATDIATICKDIVVKTAVSIAGKKYVRCEGWLAIATAHGCVASARDVERIEGGIRAIGEVRKVSDGTVIAAAEGFVGDDEPTWSKRAEYAKRAMAQTRALSRACRSAFAHVVVLMDAGLSTIPSDEVPDGGFDDHDPKRQLTARTAKPVSRGRAIDHVDDSQCGSETDETQGKQEEEAQFEGDWRDVVVHWGASKGKRLGDLDEKGMRFFQNWQPKAFRGRISEQDAILRAALDKARDEESLE